MKKLLLAALLTFTGAANATNPKAPNFSLRDIKGDLYELSEHRGEIIVINFWATWCGPCLIELPHLDAIDKNYEDCLLYTSPSPRDLSTSRMPSSA